MATLAMALASFDDYLRPEMISRAPKIQVFTNERYVLVKNIKRFCHWELSSP